MFHVSTCPSPSSLNKALIATVPQEALGQMQHLPYLQNRKDALVSAIASTQHDLAVMPSLSKAKKLFLHCTFTNEIPARNGCSQAPLDM
jgi:hypothetical protein